MVAMSMAEKHEKNPSKASTTKKSKFRKTADFGLNSASAWNDFNISLLGAEYDKDEYHDLPVDVTEFGRIEALNTFGEGSVSTDWTNEKGINASSQAPRQ